MWTTAKAIAVALLAANGTAFLLHNCGYWREAPGAGIGVFFLVCSGIAYRCWFHRQP